MKVSVIPTVLVGVCVFAVNSVSATPISIVNASFEDQVLADGAFTTAPLTGFTDNGVAGPLNPSGVFYTSPDVIDSGATGGTFAPADGVNVAFALAGTAAGASTTLSQELTTEVIVGQTYRLTVAVGDRDGTNGQNGGFEGFSLGITGGGLTLATTGEVAAIDAAEGSFSDVVLEFTAQAGASGLLGIDLTALNLNSATNGGVDFDNVRLEAVGAPVPEPGSLALAAIGGVALLSRKRQRNA